MDRSEAKLVLIIGSHTIEQHELDGLQMTSLRGQMERSVLREPVDSVGHQQFVNLKHGSQDLN